MVRRPRYRRIVGKAARNERRKSAATTLNALAVAVFVATFLQPALTHRLRVQALIAPAIAFVALQVGLQYVLGGIGD